MKRCNLPTELEELSETPLFSDLSKQERAAIFHLGTVIGVRPKRLLSHPGQYPRQVAVIINGSVAATTDNGAVRVLGTGQPFGTITGAPNHTFEATTVESLTQTTLWVIDPREFATVQYACPRFAKRLLSTDVLTPTHASSDNPSATATATRATRRREIMRRFGLLGAAMPSR
jgi:hypothetical protein